MSSITLTSAGKTFTFDLSYFGKDSLFASLRELSRQATIPFTGEHSELLALDALLNKNCIVPGAVDLVLKYDILPVTYELSILLENEMRKKMFTTNDVRYDALYYGLILVEEETLLEKEPKQVRKDLLFSSSKQLQPWPVIQEKLALLRKLTRVDGVFVAGGCLYSILYGYEISDIDLFLYGLSEAEAEATLLEIRDILTELYEEHTFATVIRTQNAVAFAFNRSIGREGRVPPPDEGSFFSLTREVQVILRLYRTPSMILHGFDLDSCAIGFDGNHLWISRRALYALQKGYNTVNFGRFRRRRVFRPDAPAINLRLTTRLLMRRGSLSTVQKGWRCTYLISNRLSSVTRY